MKKFHILILIIFSSICYSQTKTTHLKYFLNNKNLPVKNLEVYVITNNDTITVKTKKSRIEFPKMNSDFNLLIKANGEQFKFGKCESSVSEDNIEIVVGKITDITKLKKSEFNSKMFYLRDYLIDIQNPENIIELNFITLIQNKSLGQNKFMLQQTGTTQVIKSK